jgi:hypothetical protein
MTLPRFDALCERLYQKHRRECFYAGIIAATDINVHSSGKQFVSPMVFVPGGVDHDKERREKVKQNIRSLFTLRKPRNAEETKQMRDGMIRRLKKAGHEDAEELFNQVFPSSNRGTK